MNSFISIVSGLSRYVNSSHGSSDNCWMDNQKRLFYGNAIVHVYRKSFERGKYPSHCKCVCGTNAWKNTLVISIQSLPCKRGWHQSLLRIREKRIYSGWYQHTLEVSAGLFRSFSFWLWKYERGESKLYDISGLRPSVAVKHVKITSIDVLLFTFSKYSIVSRTNQLLGFWRQGGAISVDVITEHSSRSHPNGI